MNLKKSKLTTSQDLVYIGARFRMDLDRLYLSEDQIDGLLALVRSFSRVGQYKLALLFLSLLGLMTAILSSVEYTYYLCMHSIQLYLKCRWNHIANGFGHPILVSKDLIQALQRWSVREHLSQGMPFTLPSTTITITMDASMEGWGCHCMPAARVDHDTLQCPLVHTRTPAPHQHVRALSSLPDPSPSGAGNLWSNRADQI